MLSLNQLGWEFTLSSAKVALGENSTLISDPLWFNEGPVECSSFVLLSEIRTWALNDKKFWVRRYNVLNCHVKVLFNKFIVRLLNFPNLFWMIFKRSISHLESTACYRLKRHVKVFWGFLIPFCIFPTEHKWFFLYIKVNFRINITLFTTYVWL